MTYWHSFIENAQSQPLLDTHDKSADAITLSPLTDYALILVNGDDAMTFLQGQCTCDFSRLTNEEWLLGAHCNPKGRMISSFRSARLASGEIALRVHKSIAETALAALQKYIVFSKATITTSPNLGIGLTFPVKAQPQLEKILSTLPAPGHTGNIEHGIMLRLDDERIELWLTEANADSIVEQLQQIAITTPPQQWILSEIAAGIAEVTSESSEELLPQELNFQCLDGISFTKGCYTGQEIIARMHYKGNLKKHLYRAITQAPFTTPATQLPGYGTVVLGDNQKAGFVVRSCIDANGLCHILALVNDSLLTSEQPTLDMDNPLKLKWQPLPYAIP